ncbi:GGDEF domain-containing protein [Shewanella sedimentimangrovi]|uniref:diguanylate cyclase n=1 Tax=Shewanella sedimentimangrovi TaxID=2814293 RepID=A0ABX7QYB4_9GAMM|nr:GGDEF domain-containing protein [Shewanella sedimentimangrovi]QSX35603.1 GGDEF domain-containing protein [Shewanella sedimentimangrovi]
MTKSQVSAQAEPMPLIMRWQRLLQFGDLFSNRDHTKDFDGSRASQIHHRVQALAAIYMLVALGWMILDYISMPLAQFQAMVPARSFMAAGFMGLVFWQGRSSSLLMARIRLALLVLIPSAFYVYSAQLLEQSQQIYQYYPLITAVQLAVFPLTLIEGMVLALPVFFSVLLASQMSGYQIPQELMMTLILLVALTLWAQMSQLFMLVSLYRQATRDPLTGLFNRRALFERLQTEVLRADRYLRSVTVLLLDLDRFKRVNDQYGHLVGDKVLQSFAVAAQKAVRNVDLVGRYGGEEFLVILPETDAKHALDVAERIRESCEALLVTTDDGEEVRFTTSIGLAQWQGPEDLAELVERADNALYRAKTAGRNRVEVA